MKNLETKQKIFDKVVKHLFKQKVCAHEGDVCAYLNEKGHKCAVGCLIPFSRMSNFQPSGLVDELVVYTSKYHEKNPKNKTAKQFLNLLKKNENFLFALQECHDSHGRDIVGVGILSDFDLPLLQKQLIKIAKRYKLNYNHLKELTKEYK